MSNLAFKVYERNVKENKNRLRNAGEIPGIIYGEYLNRNIPIKISDSELARMFKENNSGSIIELSLPSKKINCVVKEIQKNEKHEVLHVDFQYVKPNEIIKMRIPIKFIGQDVLEGKRLTLETYSLYIDLQGDVEKIPEFIELAASDLQLDDKIFIKDMDIPEDITISNDPETLLAVVSSQYFA